MNNKVEKEYKIEIIASIIENALFCTNEELYEFCEDLLNENVSILNFNKFLPDTKEEINRQYPEIKRITGYPTTDYGISSIESIIEEYKCLYGDKLTFKVYDTNKKVLKPFHFKYKK